MVQLRDVWVLLQKKVLQVGRGRVDVSLQRGWDQVVDSETLV